MKRDGKATVLAIVAVLAGTIGGVSLSGCGGGSGPGTQVVTSTRGASDPFFGSWRLVSVGGGITGQGYPVEGDTRVTFNRDGTTTETKNGQVTFTGRYQVVRTSNQFEGNPPVVEYVPEGRLALVILRADATGLQLAEEAADGYGYTYERVP